MDDEQRSLKRITRMMRVDDPALERALATGRFRNRRRYAAGTGTAAVALVALFVALCVGQGLMILGAWMMFAVGVLVRVFAD